MYDLEKNKLYKAEIDRMRKIQHISIDGFLMFKVPDNLKNIEINEIEISPCNDESICYINYKHTINVPLMKERPIQKIGTSSNTTTIVPKIKSEPTTKPAPAKSVTTKSVTTK